VHTENPRRTAVIATATVVVVVGGLLVTGRLPGAPRREGPLEGTSGVAARLPVAATDEGVIWGNLVLENHSGATVVLDSVQVARNPEKLRQLVPAYLWDQDRLDHLDSATVDGYQLPLPAQWRLPPRREVDGFELRSTGRAESAGDTLDDVEVLLEFDVPQRVSPLTGITVDYHVGWINYRRTFDISLTVFPRADSSGVGGGFDDEGVEAPDLRAGTRDAEGPPVVTERLEHGFAGGVSHAG
jgi:hypothetical protein